MEELAEAVEEVHETLGPGFTETVYHSALLVELSKRGIETSTEATIPVLYKGHSVGQRRPDLFVESEDESLVVELKAGSDRGDEQLLQYLDLLDGDGNFDIDEGWLVKFNEDVEIIKKNNDTSD